MSEKISLDSSGIGDFYDPCLFVHSCLGSPVRYGRNPGGSFTLPISGRAWKREIS